MNGKSRNFNQKNYEYYVSEYIRLSEEHGSPLSHAVNNIKPGFHMIAGLFLFIQKSVIKIKKAR